MTLISNVEFRLPTAGLRALLQLPALQRGTAYSQHALPAEGERERGGEEGKRGGDEFRSLALSAPLLPPLASSPLLPALWKAE